MTKIAPIHIGLVETVLKSPDYHWVSFKRNGEVMVFKCKRRTCVAFLDNDLLKALGWVSAKPWMHIKVIGAYDSEQYAFIRRMLKQDSNEQKNDK